LNIIFEFNTALFFFEQALACGAKIEIEQDNTKLVALHEKSLKEGLFQKENSL